MAEEGPTYWARDAKALFDSSGIGKEIQEKKDSFASAESIFFASDYGGEDQWATYRTYAFLVTPFQNVAPWFARVRTIYENRFGGKLRSMEFKKLRDEVKQRALREWLEAADDINGCLFTLSVHKSIQTIFGQPSEAAEVARKLAAANLGNWTDWTAEKVLRVLHFQGFLSSLLLRDGQKIFWMTDRDSICPNPAKAEELWKAWPRVLYLYVPKTFRVPKHHIQPPFLSEKLEERIYDDTLTYPDLAAGALQEFFSDHVHSDGSWKKPEARRTTVEIIRWLALRGTKLSRFHIKLEAQHEGGAMRLMPSVIRLDLKPDADQLLAEHPL